MARDCAARSLDGTDLAALRVRGRPRGERGGGEGAAGTGRPAPGGPVPQRGLGAGGPKTCGEFGGKRVHGGCSVLGFGELRQQSPPLRFYRYPVAFSRSF